MRTKHGLAATAIVTVLAWAHVAGEPAVQPVSPFDIVGFIDAATLDAPSRPGDVFEGGTVTVNGTTIIVPRNTILQMPALALSWHDVFALAPAPYGPTQSGLARSDTPTPPVTYEVHIQGNRVVSDTSDQYIAGLMFLSQQALNAGAGFINAIDYGTGELRVGGAIGDSTTGARVRINDPAGRFGLAMTPDPRFTIDEDNPTVRSETGYPMCIPRTATPDPLCPESNRPRDVTGTPLTVFTMDPPAYEGGPPTVTDPYLMAPFEVGDYVTYSGNLLNDAHGHPYISAFSVIANVGIFTAPGTQPTYVAIDVMLLGVGGVPSPNLPQEAAVRTRIEGFSTDPTSFVDLFAVDVDPCTGEETWRYYATVGVDPGPPTGRVAGRWRWLPNQDAPFLPPTRMLLAMSENGIVYPKTPNGLWAGQYTAPNFDFIFPENLGIGSPPVPMTFQDFPFLANGSGPYNGIGQIGQLSPWPGAVAPLAPVCTPSGAMFAPVADAGLHQSATPGSLVTLDASASHDTNATPLALSFFWTQTGGLHVPLANADTAQPTFTAPPLDASGTPMTLEFTATVSNGVLSSSAKVTVTNARLNVPADTLTVITSVFRVRRSRLDVAVSSSNPAAILTLQGFGVMSPGSLAPGVAAPPNVSSIVIVGVHPQPMEVTVTSSLGGSITAPVIVR